MNSTKSEIDMFIILILVMISCVCIMPKSIKLYTLNMNSFLYINYTCFYKGTILNSLKKWNRYKSTKTCIKHMYAESDKTLKKEIKELNRETYHSHEWKTQY